MANTTFKLDTRRALADGTYPVKISVGFSTNILLSTGVSCTEADWNPKLLDPYTGKHSKRVNNRLHSLLGSVVAKIDELREAGRFDKMDKRHLKEWLSGVEHPEEEAQGGRPKLAEIFRQYIATCNKPRTAELYSLTLRKLGAYCNPEAVDFDDITKLWLAGFESSMNNLSPNGRSIHLRNLRTIINVAIDERLTTNYPFRHYKIPKQRTRKRALTVETLRLVRDTDFGSSLNRYRDIFMLSFYLIGINVVDLCGLEDMESGRVNFHRAKTGRFYSIKVEPEAAELIDRHAGCGHLLYMMDNNSHYRHFYNRFAAALHDIGQILGIELTSYWARHTWATIAASLEIPKDTIAAALGHGGDTVTDIYIDFDQRKVDEANRRVLDFLKG